MADPKQPSRSAAYRRSISTEESHLRQSQDHAEAAKKAGDEYTAWASRLVGWLAIGNLGSFGFLGGFAAQLDEPISAVKAVLPSLWLFLLGATLAGFAVGCLAWRSEVDGRNALLKSWKFFIGDPRLAPPELQEVERRMAHLSSRLRRLFLIGLGLSALCLLLGLTLPLIQATIGDLDFLVSPVAGRPPASPPNG